MWWWQNCITTCASIGCFLWIKSLVKRHSLGLCTGIGRTQGYIGCTTLPMQVILIPDTYFMNQIYFWFIFSIFPNFYCNFLTLDGLLFCLGTTMINMLRHSRASGIALVFLWEKGNARGWCCLLFFIPRSYHFLLWPYGFSSLLFIFYFGIFVVSAKNEISGFSWFNEVSYSR